MVNGEAHIFVDSSECATGASLMQQTEKGYKAISHFSRMLNNAERKWPATHLELAAIVWALRNFDVYVHNAQLVIHTNHKPLMWLNSGIEKISIH